MSGLLHANVSVLIDAFEFRLVRSVVFAERSASSQGASPSYADPVCFLNTAHHPFAVSS